MTTPYLPPAGRLTKMKSDAQAEEAPAFGSGTVTVQITDGSLLGKCIVVATGNNDGHGWIFQNIGGGNSNDFQIDTGGGPTNEQVAADLEAQINAVALAGLTVSRSTTTLTLTCEAGVLVDVASTAGITIT